MTLFYQQTPIMCDLHNTAWNPFWCSWLHYSAQLNHNTVILNTKSATVDHNKESLITLAYFPIRTEKNYKLPISFLL